MPRYTGHDKYCFCGCGNGERANGMLPPRRDPFGSTMYDRRARRNHEPAGASGHVNLRGEDAGQGHGTQYYTDGYRLSRDTDGEGDDFVHWTNQNLGKKHDDRHLPPSDARY